MTCHHIWKLPAGGPCLISDARLSYPALTAEDLNAGLHLTGWSAAGLTNGRAAANAFQSGQPIQVTYDSSQRLPTVQRGSRPPFLPGEGPAIFGH